MPTLPTPRIVWQQQRERHGPGAERGDQVQHPPIDDVGDGAAVEAERDDGHQPGETDQTDVQRRVRERVDLHRDGDLGQHRPDERGPLPDQQAAVRTNRQRPGVDSLPTQAFAHRPALLDGLGPDPDIRGFVAEVARSGRITGYLLNI